MDKSNKRLIYILAIISVILLLILIIFALVKFVSSITSKGSSSTNSTSDSKTKITQLYVMGIAYSDGGKTEDTNKVNVEYETTLNISTEKEISKITISNIKLDPGINGAKYKILQPKHKNRTESINWYYGDSQQQPKISSVDFDGNKFEYKVTSDASQLYYDEVSKNGGILSFRIFLPELASYDYTAIMNRDKVFESAKLLSYAGVSADKLNTNLKFDLEVKYSNGKKSSKSISVPLTGDILVQNGYNIFYNNDLINTEF